MRQTRVEWFPIFAFALGPDRTPASRAMNKPNSLPRHFLLQPSKLARKQLLRLSRALLLCLCVFLVGVKI